MGNAGNGTINYASITPTNITYSGNLRKSTAGNRRYYHLNSNSFDPGGSGATWVSPNANTLGGWNLTNAGHGLEFNTDVHSDWDEASDLKVEIYFELNASGSNEDTVDLRLQCFYKTVGDASTKSQTVEVATVTDGTQYKMYKAEFTIDYDAVSNVVEAGDKISFILNLETDTSEIDDIIVSHGSFYYNTTHVGIESTDV